MAISDGQNRNLLWRQPSRERPCVMLNQGSRKAFQATENGAVDHDRLLGLTVFIGVFQLKPVWQVEIELDGGTLPGPPNGVFQLEVDFRPVKCSIARVHLV